MEKEFYETWRKEHGITIEGYQLNRRQLIEMLTDFKHHIEQLHKHDVMGSVCDHTHVLWINSDWKYFCLDCGAVNITN